MTFTGSAATSIFVRGLELMMSIGVHSHEKAAKQRVIVTVEADVDLNPGEVQDDIARVVSYSDIVAAIRGIAEAGHINLLETFAERIASALFTIDSRIAALRIRAEKPDVYAAAEAAGVEISRNREN